MSVGRRFPSPGFKRAAVLSPESHVPLSRITGHPSPCLFITPVADSGAEGGNTAMTPPLPFLSVSPPAASAVAKCLV